MSTLALEAKAEKVWFDEHSLWVALKDGRSLSVPLAFFPRLLAAKPELRSQCTLSGGGAGLHWEALDEDISVAGLLLGQGDQTLHR